MVAKIWENFIFHQFEKKEKGNGKKFKKVVESLGIPYFSRKNKTKEKDLSLSLSPSFSSFEEQNKNRKCCQFTKIYESFCLSIFQ
jgi:hypothetical protein